MLLWGGLPMAACGAGGAPSPAEDAGAQAGAAEVVGGRGGTGGGDAEGRGDVSLVATAGWPILVLAADDSAICWIEHEPGSDRFDLVRQPLEPAHAAQILATQTYTEPAFGLAADLLIDRGEVIWRWPGTGWLRSLPVAGGEVTALADVDRVQSVAVDLNAVYYTDGQRAWRVPRAGGGATELGALEFATGVVADGYNIYVIDRLAAALVRFPVDGSEPQYGWTTWLGDNTMLLDQGPGHLVWSSNSSGRLLAASKPPAADAGTVFTVAEDAATMLGEVEVGAAEVFVAPGLWDFDHTVRRWSLEGDGEVTVVAEPGEACAAHIARVGQTLYWSDCEGGVHRWPAE